MYVRREKLRRIKRADTHKADQTPRSRIVTPERDPTLRAAENLLASATVGGRLHFFDRAAYLRKAITFYHRVQSKRRATLALTPSAVAAIDEHRCVFHTVTNVLAGTAALYFGFVFSSHESSFFQYFRVALRLLSWPRKTDSISLPKLEYIANSQYNRWLIKVFLVATYKPPNFACHQS